jgi:hypothetical protein
VDRGLGRLRLPASVPAAVCLTVIDAQYELGYEILYAVQLIYLTRNALGWTTWDVYQQTTLQARTPDHLRGRVAACTMVLVNGAAAAGGFIGAAIATATLGHTHHRRRRIIYRDRLNRTRT